MPRRSWSRSESLGWVGTTLSEASTGGRAPKIPCRFPVAKKRTTKVATQTFFLIFLPLFGEMMQFEEHMFRMGGSTTNRRRYGFLCSFRDRCFDVRFSRIGEVASSFKHCWWFRNPAITSWYIVKLPHYLQGIQIHLRWLALVISDPINR